MIKIPLRVGANVLAGSGTKVFAHGPAKALLIICFFGCIAVAGFLFVRAARRRHVARRWAAVAAVCFLLAGPVIVIRAAMQAYVRGVICGSALSAFLTYVPPGEHVDTEVPNGECRRAGAYALAEGFGIAFALAGAGTAAAIASTRAEEERLYHEAMNQQD